MKRAAGTAWAPLAALAIALAAILLLLMLGESGVLARLEGGLLDLRFRLRPARAPETRITVVAIDEASIDRIGRWPWSRTVLAQALDRVHSAGAAVVGIDILLSEAEGAVADQALAQALAATPALLPFAEQAGPPAAAPHWMARFEYGRVAGNPLRVHAVPALKLPIPMLGEAATGLGDVSLSPDATGTYRSEHPVVRLGEALYPSFDLEAVRLLRHATRADIVVHPRMAIDVDGLTLPTDNETLLILDTDPPARFEVHSFIDLLDGRVPAAALQGRLVLIGATARGLGDRMPTAFDPAVPGVLRHAAAISGLLDGRVVRHDDTIFGIDVLTIAITCLAVGMAARRALLPGLVTAALCLVALPALDVLAFDAAGWWLDASIPFAAVTVTAAAILALHLRERAVDLAALQLATRHDGLTGLANRAGVRAWMDRAGDARCLVCAGDLDGFKQVNDTLGHPAGDALLREVATRLRQAMRPGDLAARLGGDEFLLLLRAADPAAALAVAREAFLRVSAPYTLEGQPAAVGISLGIAAWPDDDRDWDGVMALADAALYAAKRAGKRRIYRATGPGAASEI